MSRKTVSIIMGIYNCAETLGMSIESLLNQTYKDWELILCDDGSTDCTYAIASRFADKHNNILLIKNGQNKGLGYTLNRCLEIAEGKYIARMDGDDISFPERLEKEVEFLEKNQEYALVSTNVIYFDENGDWAVGKVIENPQKEDFVKFSPFCHPASMVRKSVYNSVKGYTDEKRFLRVEDYHLWIKIYSLGYRGYNIAQPLYKVRDDRKAMNRRLFRYRINEAYVKYLAIKMLKLPMTNIVYLIRPILVGILPRFIYIWLHRNRLKKQTNSTISHKETASSHEINHQETN